MGSLRELLRGGLRLADLHFRFLTPEQQEWKEMRRAISSLKPLKRREGPSNKFRSFFYHLINHAWFEYFITFSICANVIVMVILSEDQTNADCRLSVDEHLQSR